MDTSDAGERRAITNEARIKLKEMSIAHATIELELPDDECAFEHH
ncbi:MAG: hypothetical protein ACOH13_05100 [Flavobacteriales bacterium]